MGIKRFRPTTPGLRFKAINDFAEITTGNNPEKSLVTFIGNTGGRNNTGKMTVRNVGGGHKRQYRIIDFRRDKNDVPAVVKTVEYDPNRSAFIALLFYADGEKRYIIAPKDIKVGQTVVSGKSVAPEIGNSMPLSAMPLGTVIHNIEMQPGRGGVLARSAGTYATLSARDGRYATIKLPSGESRMILVVCVATVGSVSNPDNFLIVSGKAGRNRWLGRRSRVRGVAMNPVDHPMGGGEGRSSGGQPRSRTGVLSKGFKTRDKKKASDKFIISRRKK